MRLGVGLVAGQVDLRRPGERALTLQHVLRDVDEHRPGSSTRCDVKRLGHHARDVVTVADQEVVLGHRHRDAGDVGLLERVRADQRPPDLPGDRDHRDRVHVGVGQRCDEVGGAGTGGRHADPDPAGGMRVAAGGVTATLLVPDQDVAQLLGVEQRVVHRQHRTAGDAEDDVDIEFLERPDHCLCPGELLGGNPFRLRGRRGRSRLRGNGGRCGVAPVRRCRRLLGWSRSGSAHCVPLVVLDRCWGKKKPPSAHGCTRVARRCVVAMPGSGLARHQRATQLLRPKSAPKRFQRAIPGSA